MHIIYRRSEEEMPARHEEVLHAKEEGVEFTFLAAPLEFIDNGQGWLKSVRLQRMLVGRAGWRRRNTVPIEGSEFTMDWTWR